MFESCFFIYKGSVLRRFVRIYSIWLVCGHLYYQHGQK